MRRPLFSAISMCTAGLLFAAFGAVVSAGPAGAHSSLIGASPAPGQVVGGEISRIELVYDAGVERASVVLESPTGVDVEGVLKTDVKNVLVLEVDPELLAEPGNWIVRYEFVSEDGDAVSLAYAYQYDPAEPAPLPAAGETTLITGSLEDGGDSTSPTVLIVSSIGLLVLAGGGIMLADRLRKKRLGPPDR